MPRRLRPIAGELVYHVINTEAMMSQSQVIHVPKAAVKYLLFQRTRYLFIRRNAAAKYLKGFLPSRIAGTLESLITRFSGGVAFEALFTRKTVERLYSEEMSLEFDQIRPYLPTTARAILDIGCGIGGIDVLLSKHYQNDKPAICLLDKTELPSRVYYGFKDRGCYYNSLAVTKDVLVQNGVSEGAVFTQEATEKNSIDFDRQFDLVLSIISWGFHYPVSTYIDQVYEKLAPGGVLILDLRKDQEGLELLKEKFGSATVIHQCGISDRVMARKPS